MATAPALVAASMHVTASSQPQSQNVAIITQSQTQPMATLPSHTAYDRVHDYILHQDPTYGVMGDNDVATAPALVAASMHVTASSQPQSQNVAIIAQSQIQPMATLPSRTALPLASVQNNSTNMAPRVSQLGTGRVTTFSSHQAGMIPTYSCLNPSATVYAPGHTGRNVSLQPSAAQIQDHSVSELARIFQQQMHMSRLPPPEPGMFLGDPIQFPSWLTSFELLIESRQLTAAERLHYLKRYLGGPAKECIEGFVVISTDSAYEEAKKLLKERFGDNFTVANAFRRKLHEWPKISGNDAASLTKLSDFLQQCQAVMRVNTYLKILDDCHENQEILKKLPDWIITRWARAVSDWTDIHRSFPPFGEFCRFISKEAKIANNPVTGIQNVKPARVNKKSDDITSRRHVGATEASQKENKLSNLQTSNNAERRKRACHLCSGDHHLNVCQNFLKKKLADRTRYIKENRLCFGCLKPNHVSKDCRSKMKCKTCSKSHPTSLHDDTWKPRNSDETSENTVVKERITVGKTNVSSAKPYSSTTMIVPVYVSSHDKPQVEQLVYAMLDTQSDASFITEKTCNSLEVGGPSVDLILSTMSSEGEEVKARKVSNLVVRGYDSSKRLDLPPMYTTAEVPGNKAHIPTSRIASQWPHLQPVVQKLPPLLDADFGLLIGYNCSQALTPREVIASPINPKEPYAQRTDLGWSIIGSLSEQDMKDDWIYCHTAATHLSGRASIVLKTKVKEVFKPADFAQLSKLDFEFPEERKQSYEDCKFMRQLTENIHESNGHYEMPLPFKKNDPIFPDNKDIASKRLTYLKGRLEKDSHYKEDYRKFMQVIIDKGYCERVADSHEHRPGTRWFIPHHGVYHPKKSKIRVVFDCSATCRGISLNDMLLQGPDMINNLMGVLCRFRKEPIAISCDIEQMFYQFYVNEEHRDYLSFLWWDSDNYDVEPAVYRMKVHLFGAVSSPGCANFGMTRAADDGEERFGKPAADFVRHDFYVDDGLTSVSTAELGKELVNNTVQLCANKGLHLHKFVSNSVEVLQSIPSKERLMNVENLQLDHELTVERTLGLEWCVQMDCFQFRIVLKDRPPTRRGILSTVYSLFDPLGLLSPVILVGRQILQDICKEQYDWDSPLPENVIARWNQWKEGLMGLENLKIDRCYKPKDFTDIVRAEVHHFSDASTEGYGQCSYLRLVDATGHIHCSLVMAKSRVSSLKQITISRLELAAAVLSVRISTLLRRQLKYDNLKEIFWCDSQIVLGYITNDAKRFHVYVANRVQEIRDKTEPVQWKYIRSQENPADYASRGLDVKSLLNDSFWFTGPAFLWQEDADTISMYHPTDVPSDDPELKKRTLVVDSIVKDEAFDLAHFSSFSDWLKLKKAVALCLRYKAILKGRIKGQNIDPAMKIVVEDLQIAETEILKVIQKDAFRSELSTLSSDSKNRNAQRKLKQTHSLFRLDPFIDSQGILRIGGRIQAASLAFEVKHPVVLPKLAYVSKLIAEYCHKATSHQGRSTTMNEIRAKGYWIIGCRGIVSSLINKCVPCMRLRGTVLDQRMADLPADRLEPSPPFTYCAVDL